MAPKEASMGAGSKGCKDGIVIHIIGLHSKNRQYSGLAHGGHKGTRTPKDRNDDSILANLLCPPEPADTHHTRQRLSFSKT